jgi:hypothetical protein
MSTTYNPVPAPQILINGNVLKLTESWYHNNLGKQVFVGDRDSFTTGTKNDVARYYAPCTLTFNVPGYTTAIVKYTFNSKKVNLGSKTWFTQDPAVTIYSGGNGFDGECLTIRAKAYWNGHVSATAEADVRIIKPAAGLNGQMIKNLHGYKNKWVYRGDTIVRSQTGV